MIKIYNHRRSLYTLTKQIKKSIKDKSNILTYNQWSATEYNNNFNNFAQLNTVTSTHDHTSIGETSIKLTKTDNYWWFDLMLLSIETNINYTLTIDIYLENGSFVMRQNDTGNTIREIYYNNQGQGTISLSIYYETLTDPRIRFLIYNENTTNVFIDNLRLTPQ